MSMASMSTEHFLNAFLGYEFCKILENAVAVHVAVRSIEKVEKPFNGGAGGARTHDRRIMSPLL